MLFHIHGNNPILPNKPNRRVIWISNDNSWFFFQLTTSILFKISSLLLVVTKIDFTYKTVSATDDVIRSQSRISVKCAFTRVKIYYKNITGKTVKIIEAGTLDCILLEIFRSVVCRRYPFLKVLFLESINSILRRHVAFCGAVYYMHTSTQDNKHVCGTWYVRSKFRRDISVSVSLLHIPVYLFARQRQGRVTVFQLYCTYLYRSLYTLDEQTRTCIKRVSRILEFYALDIWRVIRSPMVRNLAIPMTIYTRRNFQLHVVLIKVTWKSQIPQLFYTFLQYLWIVESK